MKTLFALTVLVCAALGVSAQQPTPSPVPVSRQRAWHAHRPVKRIIATEPTTQPANAPALDFFVGEAKVNISKDETVIRLAMAQHGSVLIELPANDGPRYIIPGDPEMATVDEKALERNKRAIVVRPGSLFVTPPANHKARTPAATVTAQMRSGLVVTFLFYPVEDLAQNVHRCVLSYNRDEVVARRRAAGPPVNLDADNKSNTERGDLTGQSTARTSISVEESAPPEKPSEKESVTTKGDGAKEKVGPPQPVPSPATSLKPIKSTANEVDGKVRAAASEALARAVKKWTKPVKGLALSIMPATDAMPGIQLLTLAVRNKSAENLKLVSGSPDLFVEMRDEQDKPINLESVRKLHSELSDASGELQPGKTVYFVIAYASPVLGSQQQLKLRVAQTAAADEPASIAVVHTER
jgi:hypothetical protein